MFSSLSFSYQAIKVIRKVGHPNLDDAVWPASEEEIEGIKRWVRKLFLTFVLGYGEEQQQNIKDRGPPSQRRMRNAEDNSESELAQLELLVDLDYHYKFNHSLAGNAPIGFADVMLLSFLRRYRDIRSPKCVFALMPRGAKCMNMYRVLQHISEKFDVGHAAMDKKE